MMVCLIIIVFRYWVVEYSGWFLCCFLLCWVCSVVDYFVVDGVVCDELFDNIFWFLLSIFEIYENVVVFVYLFGVCL